MPTYWQRKILKTIGCLIMLTPAMLFFYYAFVLTGIDIYHAANNKLEANRVEDIRRAELNRLDAEYLAIHGEHEWETELRNHISEPYEPEPLVCIKWLDR